MFFRAAIAANGLPFRVERKKKPNAEFMEVIEDIRNEINLYEPFNTAAEAVASMLAGEEDEPC